MRGAVAAQTPRLQRVPRRSWMSTLPGPRAGPTVRGPRSYSRSSSPRSGAALEVVSDHRAGQGASANRPYRLSQRKLSEPVGGAEQIIELVIWDAVRDLSEALKVVGVLFAEGPITIHVEHEKRA